MALKTLLITQARTGSTRFPGKVLKQIEGLSLLEIHLKRLSRCQRIDKILVATTVDPEDERIYSSALNLGYSSYKGSVENVLDRFYQAALPLSPRWIVRVTSDCPLIDPILVDEVVQFVQNSGADYGSNTLIEHFPDGQDIEVFTFSALEKAWREATKKSEREHVTPYIRDNSSFKGGNLFSAVNFPSPQDFSKIRMTVDEERDFLLVQKLIGDIGIDKTWEEYTQYILKNGLSAINGDITRNEGFTKSIKND